MNDQKIHNLLVRYVRGELTWTQINFIFADNNVKYGDALEIMRRVEREKTIATAAGCVQILIVAGVLRWATLQNWEQILTEWSIIVHRLVDLLNASIG